MEKAIIGKKIGMTQFFDENGVVVPVTVIDISGCVVVGKKTLDKNGYEAVQFGFGRANAKKLKKPMKVFYEKINQEPKRQIHEFRLSDCSKYNIGDILTADLFSLNEYVDVSAISKGKGWAGVIKRWNFHRLRETHGTGPVVRKGGSIGMNSDPSRVFKGKKMSGHLGVQRVSVQNLRVVKIDTGNNLIGIRGSVPGSQGSVLYIKNSVKAKKSGGVS